MPRLGLVFQLFRRTARTQGKRLAMTVAAIAWGTLTVVLLLSFGEGLKRSLARNMRSMGEGILIVWPGSTAKAYQGYPPGRSLRFRPEDLDLLRAHVPELGAASAEIVRWGENLSRGRRTLAATVKGVEPSFGAMRNQHPQPGGRFLDEADERERRRVIFLGDRIKEELFGDADAVGETVLLGRVPFTVIGVLAHKVQMGAYSGMDENHVIVPLSTFRALYGSRYVSNFVVRARVPELTPHLERHLREALGAHHRFDPEDRRALDAWDTVEGHRLLGLMLLAIEVFLGLIGALTLLVGGVGVANIMYAVVRQRTREIGVQMALGARGSWVLGSLVLEALALTATGGALGVGVGVVVVQLLGWAQRSFPHEVFDYLGSPVFSPGVAAGVVLLLGSVGFAAGYFPSRRAAAIQPAVALRCE